VNIFLKEGENTLLLSNPIGGQKDDTILRYTRMGEALKKAAPVERPIYFSICEHGRTEPWTWASQFGVSWRVCGDISANWGGIMRNYEAAAGLWEYQQPGVYNDPDMLEIGVGDLSEDENLSHFALWCMMSAPLILGMDIRKIQAKTMQVISSPELIAINQDALLLQASRTRLQEGLDLLLKPLSDGSCALCLFNKSESPIANIRLTLADAFKQDKRLGLQPDDSLLVRNVLDSSSDCVQQDGALIVNSLRPHCVSLCIIS
jgi:hypothetical protein